MEDGHRTSFQPGSAFSMSFPFRDGDALVIVDVQKDFCPGGALAVPHGEEVVSVLNEWIALARSAGIPIYVSRDWHPAGHGSFKDQGGPWPPHCVQNTPGAEFHPDLRLPGDAVIVTKGTDSRKDAYSAFDRTNLADLLYRGHVRRLWVGGLALDYCVRATVLDALTGGFEVHLLQEATRAVDVQPGDGRRALEELRAAGTVIEERSTWVDDENAALFTDLYELTMLQAYFDEGMGEPAVFDLFFRRLPRNRNYLLACGLDDALQYLERLRFTPDAIAYLEGLKCFSRPFLDSLHSFRFRGNVYAVPEGTPVFPHEPLLQVEAPIAEAQIAETFIMNQVHFQTLAASKAARVVAAARGRSVVDFGLRRMHGADAGIKGARAFYVGGIDSTSNVLAGRLYGIPLAGTMAHSYVQAHRDELDSFRQFSRSFPQSTLLVDTYDTLEGVRRVIRLARELGAAFRVRAVRLDSGDLGALARESRRLLDEGGLQSVEIFASGSLDEHEIRRLVEAGAPITGFGVGSRMGVSEDAPYLDMAYKLSAYAGEGRIKLSANKSNLPLRKQVYRDVESDIIALHDEVIPGRPLMVPVMRGGVRLPAGQASLLEARERARSGLAQLPERCRRLEPADPPYRVDLSAGLERETERLRRTLSGRGIGEQVLGRLP